MTAAIIERFSSGELSAELTLMELLTETEDLQRVEQAITGHPPLERLLESNREGCLRIIAMLKSGLDSPEPAPTIEESLARTQRLFDASVQASPESSVALYSLGNPAILARATEEIIEALDRWSLIGRHVRALEIGCGIGRLVAPIAARVAHVTGIDLSSAMIAEATRRTAGRDNVTLETTHGRDLRRFEDQAFDLVYAVDVFPYLRQAGLALVESHVAECARVLAPGGALAILSYSYDPSIDGRAELGHASRAHGLTAVIEGERPFTMWNGQAFIFRSAGDSARSTARRR